MDEKVLKTEVAPEKTVEAVKTEPQPKVEPVKDDPKKVVEPTPEPVKETPKKEPTPVPVPVAKVPEKLGVVVDCMKLRVRKNPNQNSEVITTITNGSEVKIDEAKSTGAFFKVCTASGVEGFCMKKYIRVKP